MIISVPLEFMEYAVHSYAEQQLLRVLPLSYTLNLRQTSLSSLYVSAAYSSFTLCVSQGVDQLYECYVINTLRHIPNVS